MAKDKQPGDMADVDLNSDLTDKSNEDVQRTMSNSDKQQEDNPS